MNPLGIPQRISEGVTNYVQGKKSLIDSSNPLSIALTHFNEPIYKPKSEDAPLTKEKEVANALFLLGNAAALGVSVLFPPFLAVYGLSIALKKGCELSKEKLEQNLVEYDKKTKEIRENTHDLKELIRFKEDFCSKKYDEHAYFIFQISNLEVNEAKTQIKNRIELIQKEISSLKNQPDFKAKNQVLAKEILKNLQELEKCDEKNFSNELKINKDVWSRVVIQTNNHTLEEKAISNNNRELENLNTKINVTNRILGKITPSQDKFEINLNTRPVLENLGQKATFALDNFTYGKSNGITNKSLSDLNGLWKGVDSSQVKETNIPIKDPANGLMREDFLNHAASKDAPVCPPPVIGSTLSNAQIDHMVRGKATNAQSTKSSELANLTNVEAHVSTVGMIPLTLVETSGQIYFDPTRPAGENWQAAMHMVDGQQATRQIVVSGRAQLDFEKPDIALQMFAADQKEGIKGQDHGEIPPLSKQERSDPSKVAEYDKKLREQEIFKYTEAGIPGVDMAKEAGKIKTLNDFKKELKKAVEEDSELDLKGVLIEASYGKKTVYLSAEMMFNSIKAADKSEFTMLNTACPNGYAFSRQPPSIYMQIWKQPGDKTPAHSSFALMTEYMVALSAKQLTKENPEIFANMKEYSYNDFAQENNEIIKTFKKALEGTKAEVIPWKEKLDADHQLKALPGVTQHIPANDDANAENHIGEGTQSQHGALAVYSNYAAVSNRFMEQQTGFVIDFREKQPS